MTSPLPPKRRDSRNLADLLRQDRTRLGQLDRGLVGGRFPPAKPPKPPYSDGGEDDFNDPAILFENSDHAACSANGATINIPLTHVPEPGSEQVYYNGTPLKWSDWSRTDAVLTIPGEPWFRAGKVAWVDYLYYDGDGETDTEPATYVDVTTITGDHASINMPGTPTPGDLLVLVLFGRDVAACSDPRFTFKTGGGGYWGIWVGTDDGTTSTVPITLSSPSGGGVDGAGALARITGSPLLPATSEQTSGASGVSTFAPTMPSAGTFGVMAMISGTGLVSGSLSGDTLGNWTTRAQPTGGGSGFCKVYIGTAVGTPAGQWTNSGSGPGWGAWVGGLQ